MLLKILAPVCIFPSKFYIAVLLRGDLGDLRGDLTYIKCNCSILNPSYVHQYHNWF